MPGTAAFSLGKGRTMRFVILGSGRMVLATGAGQTLRSVAPKVSQRGCVAEMVGDQGEQGLDAVRPEFLRAFHPTVDLLPGRLHVRNRDRQALFAVVRVSHPAPCREATTLRASGWGRSGRSSTRGSSASSSAPGSGPEKPLISRTICRIRSGSTNEVGNYGHGSSAAISLLMLHKQPTFISRQKVSSSLRAGASRSNN